MPSHAILVDECVDLGVLGPLRAWGHPAKRCDRAGHSDSPSDEEIIEAAAAQGRIVLTDDARTMPRRLYEYVEAGNEHPGMLLGTRAWSRQKYLSCLYHTLEMLQPADLRNSCTRLVCPDGLSS